MALIRMVRLLLVVVFIVIKLLLQCISLLGNATISEVGVDEQEWKYSCLRESTQQQHSSVSSPSFLHESNYAGKHHCWDTGNDLACEITTQAKARSLIPCLPGSSENYGHGFLGSCREPPPLKGKRATTLVTMYSLPSTLNCDIGSYLVVIQPNVVNKCVPRLHSH